MKKIILNLLAVTLLLTTSVFILAGCGGKKDSKKEKSNNKQNEVITVSDEKVVHAEYIRGGGYDSNLEMTFKDNKLTKFVMIFDCATEEAAQEYYNSSQKDIEGTDTEMTIDGKRVTVTMSAEGYMKMSGLTEDQLDEGTMRQVALGMGYNTLD